MHSEQLRGTLLYIKIESVVEILVSETYLGLLDLCRSHTEQERGSRRTGFVWLI